MNQKEKRTKKRSVRGAAKRVAILAMMTAMGVIIGFFCKNYTTYMVYYRFTLENLGVLISGIFFGPVSGAMVGLATDIISCLLSTNPAVNPIITLGAVTVGLVAGAVPRLMPKADRRLVYAVTVALAHLTGQVIIKSIGKMIFLGMPWYGIFIGLGLSVIAGTIEYSVILLISKNKQIRSILE